MNDLPVFLCGARRFSLHVSAFLLIIWLGNLGCSSHEPVNEVILARFDFSNAIDDINYGKLYGSDLALHWFAEGWSRNPSEHGTWAIGPSSAVQLYLLGRDCRLTIVCSTSDDLAAEGQLLTLAINGQEVGQLPLVQPWQEYTFQTRLPDAVLIQGFNQISFTPNTHRVSENTQEGEDGRPLSFRLHSLLVAGMLNPAQKKAWYGLTAASIPISGWQHVTLPPAVPEDHATGRDPYSSTEVERSAEAGSTGAVERPATAEHMADSGRPDILVFLLDAARPDHFGCYGYERNTTPNIDALAADGLRFSQVFSTASYTRCAVPSLLTGFSWRDHKVIQGRNGEIFGDALADSFLTLAELLQASGYYTVSYSSNPNFSFATNTHQGFHEFVEVWKTTGGKENTPEWTAELFDRRLAEGFAAGPILCYFHMRPPHEPYLPGPTHDLWPVQGNTEKIDGSLASIKRLDGARCDFNAAERDRLVALYDGNLHRIDAVVGHILDAWRGLHRDRPHVILVVSDHGEAFGEHCRFSHNSTVYDEMTRIPLIVAPRKACTTLAPARDQLLAITDLMPMLLHLTGTPLPPGSSWPRRFLEVFADPTTPRPAVAIRTIRGVEHVGLRTDRYLAFWNGWSCQELYDLAEDPDATRNLRPARGQLYISLMASLNAILSGSVAAGPALEADLSEEDLQTLKSLGYL